MIFTQLIFKKIRLILKNMFYLIGIILLGIILLEIAIWLLGGFFLSPIRIYMPSEYSGEVMHSNFIDIHNKNEILEYFEKNKGKKLEYDENNKKIRLTITSDKTSYNKDESIPLILKFTNISDEPILLNEYFSPYENLRIRIKSILLPFLSVPYTGPEILGPDSGIFPDSYVLLAPHEEYILRIEDLRVFYMIGRRTYKIYVDFHHPDWSEFDKTDLHDLEWKGAGRSNTIQIKVE